MEFLNQNQKNRRLVVVKNKKKWNMYFENVFAVFDFHFYKT